MLSRFSSNLTMLILAATLTTLSLQLAGGVVQWLGLGIAAVVVVLACAFLARDRGAVQRALDGPAAVIAGWMIIESRTFSGGTVRWMTFAEAVALAGLAVIGLIAHEALSERAVRRMFGDSRLAGDLVVQRRRVALPETDR